MHPGGRVVWFRLKPVAWMMWTALLVFVLGILAYVSLLEQGASATFELKNRLYMLMGLSFSVTGVLVIGATSRYWFPHLRHQRKPPPLTRG